MNTNRVVQIHTALRNFDNLITKLVDCPVKDVDINIILRDYNILRQEINKTLIEK